MEAAKHGNIGYAEAREASIQIGGEQEGRQRGLLVGVGGGDL